MVDLYLPALKIGCVGEIMGGLVLYDNLSLTNLPCAHTKIGPSRCTVAAVRLLRSGCGHVPSL